MFIIKKIGSIFVDYVTTKIINCKFISNSANIGGGNFF